MAQRIEDAIMARLNDLLSQAGALADSEEEAKCRAWIGAALTVLDLVCPSPTHAYRRQAEAIANARAYAAPNAVEILSELLKHVVSDIQSGLLVSLANRVRAEAFDDFLDHAGWYFKKQLKNEAAVIAGVVFEDTVRRICRDQGIKENKVNLDKLITDLTKAETITGIRAKRARAAAGLRTSALHARWEEFELSDVGPVIELTRELIAEHLDK